MPRALRRFYVDAVLSGPKTSLHLSPRETFHLSRVLGLKVGESCQIFDRSGLGAEAVIEAISEKGGARLKIQKTFPLSRGEGKVYLKVGQALPQKRKMDSLVEKAEELAIQELWVLETARTMVKARGEARERVRRRWERIVIESAKQSASPMLTRIEGPVSFETLLQENLGARDRAFLFHPDPSGIRLEDVVEEIKAEKGAAQPHSFFLFFGPEGGFSDDEVSLAESHGARKVFLGDSVLRIETAFVGVLSAIRFLT